MRRRVHAGLDERGAAAGEARYVLKGRCAVHDAPQTTWTRSLRRSCSGRSATRRARGGARQRDRRLDPAGFAAFHRPTLAALGSRDQNGGSSWHAGRTRASVCRRIRCAYVHAFSTLERRAIESSDELLLATRQNVCVAVQSAKAFRYRAVLLLQTIFATIARTFSHSWRGGRRRSRPTAHWRQCARSVRQDAYLYLCE